MLCTFISTAPIHASSSVRSYHLDDIFESGRCFHNKLRITGQNHASSSTRSFCRENVSGSSRSLHNKLRSTGQCHARSKDRSECQDQASESEGLHFQRTRTAARSQHRASSLTSTGTKVVTAISTRPRERATKKYPNPRRNQKDVSALCRQTCRAGHTRAKTSHVPSTTQYGLFLSQRNALLQTTLLFSCQQRPSSPHAPCQENFHTPRSTIAARQPETALLPTTQLGLLSLHPPRHEQFHAPRPRSTTSPLGRALLTSTQQDRHSLQSSPRENFHAPRRGIFPMPQISS